MIGRRPDESMSAFRSRLMDYFMGALIVVLFGTGVIVAILQAPDEPSPPKDDDGYTCLVKPGMVFCPG